MYITERRNLVSMAKYQFQGQKSDLNRHTRERPCCVFSQLKLFCPPHICGLLATSHDSLLIIAVLCCSGYTADYCGYCIHSRHWFGSWTDFALIVRLDTADYDRCGCQFSHILDKWIHLYAWIQGNDKSKDLNLASVYTKGLSLWSAPHTTRYSVCRFAILPPSISDICFNQPATYHAMVHRPNI